MQDRTSQHPHAPEVGTLGRLLGSLHVTGVFWYRFQMFGVSVLPEWALRLVTAFFTTFFFVTLRNIRAAISSNLEVALGPSGWLERQRRIYRTMWNFAWCSSERYERLREPGQGTAEVTGAENWADAARDGRGVIFVTAHIGHWEVGAMMAPPSEGALVHVVREEEMDPRAQKYLEDLFEHQGDLSFKMHFAASDPMLGTRLLQALRRGEIVALQADRLRASGRTVDAQLFGRSFQLPAGPAALARAAGVDLLPVFVFRQGRRRCRVVFKPPIQVAPRKPGDSQSQLANAMQQIASQIEWAVREQPYQWFCFRNLWPRG